MGWGAAWLEFLILFFGRMGLVFITFPLSFSCPWSPSFRHPHFWRLSGSLLFWRLQRSFLFTVVFSPSFLGGLGPVLFLFFWYFFMFGSAWLCILRFFFQNLGGRGVFLEGVQEYFEKVEMMWSNFQKARDARATRART